MTATQRYLPWGVVALGVVYLAYCAMPARPTTPFDLEGFGTLPVTYGGRVQPLDSLARNSLLIISGRQTFKEEMPNGSTVTQPAIKWLLDVLTVDSPNLDLSEEAKGAVWHQKVFRIENDQVLALMGLTARDGLRYSLAELQPHIATLESRYFEAKNKDKRDLVDEKISELRNHLNLFQELASKQSALMIPPTRSSPKWETYAATRPHAQHFEPTVEYFKMFHYYANNEPQKFNAALDDYRNNWLQKNLASDFHKSQFESFFNRFAPFYNAIVLYVFVFLLACLSWLTWPREAGPVGVRPGRAHAHRAHLGPDHAHVSDGPLVRLRHEPVRFGHLHRLGLCRSWACSWNTSTVTASAASSGQSPARCR